MSSAETAAPTPDELIDAYEAGSTGLALSAALPRRFRRVHIARLRDVAGSVIDAFERGRRDLETKLDDLKHGRIRP